MSIYQCSSGLRRQKVCSRRCRAEVKSGRQLEFAIREKTRYVEVEHSVRVGRYCRLSRLDEWSNWSMFNFVSLCAERKQSRYNGHGCTFEWKKRYAERE